MHDWLEQGKGLFCFTGFRDFNLQLFGSVAMCLSTHFYGSGRTKKGGRNEAGDSLSSGAWHAQGPGFNTQVLQQMLLVLAL